MTDTKRLQQLLDEEKFVEASGLCPLEEAMEMVDKENGLYAFAVAAYYYHGLGVKQSIGATFKYCDMATKLGYGKAQIYKKRWKKAEDTKNVLGIVTFFEVCVCIPVFVVLGIYCINNFTDYSAPTKIALYISLIAPAVATIWMIRFLLKRVNVGLMKINLLGYLLPIFAIPLTLLFMAIVYSLFFLLVITGYPVCG
ncbi:MAG: hypothetical protein Q4F34_04695 [Prevotellaceae bacterium]|nr:hypothetical protein [Prevotellaceae bacterium]